MPRELLFMAGLAAIAYFYSSVGHGGASGYLALMALFGFAPDSLRMNALLMNLIVSAIAFFSFYRAGHLRIRKVLPFLVTSMPAAYIGAGIHIHPTAYKITLGVFLIIAVLRMLITPKAKHLQVKDPPLMPSLLLGLLLGLVSGIIGIGGGILLSPLLILAGYATTKQASAAAALFIFLNSLAGLSRLSCQTQQLHWHLAYWLLMVLAGGIAGSASGSFYFTERGLTRMLSMVLLAASLKLFFF